MPFGHLLLLSSACSLQKPSSVSLIFSPNFQLHTEEPHATRDREIFRFVFSVWLELEEEEARLGAIWDFQIKNGKKLKCTC